MTESEKNQYKNVLNEYKKLIPTVSKEFVKHYRNTLPLMNLSSFEIEQIQELFCGYLQSIGTVYCMALCSPGKRYKHRLRVQLQSILQARCTFAKTVTIFYKWNKKESKLFWKMVFEGQKIMLNLIIPNILEILKIKIDEKSVEQIIPDDKKYKS